MKQDSETQVGDTTLRAWRISGILEKEEIAFKLGDLYIAENVITRARRVITPSILESQENKRILKG
jgi:hypothetical protein